MGTFCLPSVPTVASLSLGLLPPPRSCSYFAPHLDGTVFLILLHIDQVKQASQASCWQCAKCFLSKVTLANIWSQGPRDTFIQVVNSPHKRSCYFSPGQNIFGLLFDADVAHWMVSSAILSCQLPSGWQIVLLLNWLQKHKFLAKGSMEEQIF